MARNYDYVVMDNEAGMEHLSRRTARKADVLFILAGYTPVGIKSAGRISGLVKELSLEVKKTCLVINQFKQKDAGIEKQINGLGMEVAGYIPEDSRVIDISMRSGSLLDLPQDSNAFKTVEEILDKNLERK